MERRPGAVGGRRADILQRAGDAREEEADPRDRLLQRERHVELEDRLRRGATRVQFGAQPGATASARSGARECVARLEVEERVIHRLAFDVGPTQLENAPAKVAVGASAGDCHPAEEHEHRAQVADAEGAREDGGGKGGVVVVVVEGRIGEERDVEDKDQRAEQQRHLELDRVLAHQAANGEAQDKHAEEQL